LRAWPAADGLEAVDLYRRHRDEIAAVVLDVHMPGLDGPATLRALRALDPGVGCVFMTGRSGDCDEEALVALGAAAAASSAGAATPPLTPPGAGGPSP
jgi:CheY-like chemotaxis protein